MKTDLDNLKIFNNPNKIISKLPIQINKAPQDKKCFGIIGNQVKLKLIEPAYLNLIPEDVVQTFLYLFNNNEGRGIYVNIIKSKIKHWIVFNNELNGTITKDHFDLIKRLYNLIENVLKKSLITGMFFINLGNYPILHKKLYTEDKKKFIPVVSFTTSYNHLDLVLPLPKIINHKKINPGVLFIFEKRKLDNKESNSYKIYNRILELKKHPFYSKNKLDYLVLDGINKFNSIELSESNVIISDPYVPIYYQYLLNSNTNIILIENLNYFSYYSKLLIVNNQYISWSIDNWEKQLDQYNEQPKTKIIKNNLDKWVKTNLTMDKIKSKYLGFFEHLNLNYPGEQSSNIIVKATLSQSDYLDTNLNITTQLDYDKFFNLLYKNYLRIKCWSYRLNPYSSLLGKLKTNHSFVPELIKLSLTSLEPYENLHWISQRRVHLDFIPDILKNAKSVQIKQKKVVANVYNHIIENSEQLLNLNLANNSSLFYIELPPNSSNFNLWENDFLTDFETILQFINNQPNGSSFIIRIYTFHLPRTQSLIQQFINKFEKIKIIKNEWFDSFMPFRYLVGINKYKTINETVIDISAYNQLYFSFETQELIKIIKYINSEAVVDLTPFSDFELVNEWINKWFSSSYF